MRKAIFTIVVGLCLSISSIGKESQVQSAVSSVRYDSLSAEEQKQVDCLAANMQIEAGGESDKGKLAVGLVTMNRVKSHLFPKTVCGVVKQKTGSTCQFSWVCSKLKHKIDVSNVRPIAVNLFLKHHSIPDITNGALYFHNKKVKPVSGMIKTALIDNHIFYKLTRKNNFD